jgi:hypothetical protein
LIAGAVAAEAVAETPPRDLVAECEFLEISGAPLEIAALAKDAEELVDRWTTAKEYASAVRWLSHQLPKREAVWWGSQMVRRLAPPQQARDQAALNAAENWVREPSEASRRHAEAAATAAKFEGASAMLAAAVFWSGGSLAPADLPDVLADHLRRSVDPGVTLPPADVPEVLADPRLTGKAVSIALMLCTLGGTAEHAERCWQQILDQAKRIKLPTS